MNRFLNLCSWVCIAAVSYKYGYERGANDLIMDIVEWVVSGDAEKTMANLADSVDEDIRSEKAEGNKAIDAKSLN